MFVQAIETAAKFTRPIYSISRNYGSTQVVAGAATLFFVNAEGWALTCGHVADQIVAADEIENKFQSFKEELAARQDEKKRRQLIRELERKYEYSKHTTVELLNMFRNCIEGELNLRIFRSKKYDVALLKFNGFTKLLCIRWTDTGRADSPRFPIEGMLTRHLIDKDGQVIGFEMSTPGLRGQSGGPVFDMDGKVWGMQSATAHLDLNFDVDQEVIRNGLKKRVKDSAFLHVGHCIHVDVLKSFMREQGVQFQEE